MTTPPVPEETFRFDEPGTLVKPRWIGRLVRLILGILCLGLVWKLAVDSTVDDLTSLPYIAFGLFALALIPYVINIGFGVRWGMWPRVAFAGLVLGSAAYSYMTHGTLVAQIFWLVVNGMMIYTYAHLGLSFCLAAVLATPGCEMRALAHLAGLLRQQDTREHYCPGFIRHVDEWEIERRDGTQASPGNHSDLLDGVGAKLAIYGIPFLALQVAGNLAGFLLATMLPAIAFLFVGIFCLYNAYRSRRVHCIFMAPWCLAAGTMTLLYSLRMIDFGPDTWSIIVNTGLAGAFLIYIGSERMFGRYFRDSSPK